MPDSGSDEEKLAKKREYARRYREANKERVHASAERYRKANRERINERMRRNYEENPEPKREYVRRYAQENPERKREQNRRSYQNNRPRERERLRQQRLNGIKSAAERRRDAIVTDLWHAQGGRCYLCERSLALEAAVLEHDHRCCPKMNTYCAYCIRGAACTQCNTAIGLLREDPDMLERVAHNLRIKLTETAIRVAAKPTQAALDDC
jgi:hypothetical protein